MRTLRKAFCILILAGLVTSSAAMAAPAARSGDGHSIGSWALAVLDSIVALLLPDEILGGVDPGSSPDPESLEKGEEPPDEIVGGVDPHG
jgi:hypothetical protein